jgi:ADP-heptose:LPS heptosyltransferase
MKTLLIYIVKYIYLQIERLAILLPEEQHKHGVVLIRLDAIGDFVLWLDTAKEYRRLFPDQKITLIANAAWADLARQFPHWDEVWALQTGDLDLRRPLQRWRLLRGVRKAGFHTAIHPTATRLLAHGDSVVRASNATKRIGSSGYQSISNAMEIALANRWYTNLFPEDQKSTMELLRNAEFFSRLEGRLYTANLPNIPPMTTAPFAPLTLTTYFVIFPGASWSGRQWPGNQFAETLSELHRRYGWLPALCGGANEVALCDAIVKAASVRCLNLAGKTSLSELAEIIRGAKLLISNETSAVHLAAATATPAVCILGGGHYGRFMPYPNTMPGIKPVVAAEIMPCYHCHWHCTMPHPPHGPVPCISSISISAVLNASQQALHDLNSGSLDSPHASQ